jgi:hypothetical protein
MIGDRAPTSNVIRLADWEWRRPRRPSTRFARALAGLEPGQREAVSGLLDVVGEIAATFWARYAEIWPHGGGEIGQLPTPGLPLAEFGDEALVSSCLEAGYTLGDADTFKAVLPYFLAAAFARPLDNWVLDPDLLKAKLETLAFHRWPAAERRAVAFALSVYADHEIAMADRAVDDDEALLAAKRWAEHALAAAL